MYTSRNHIGIFKYRVIEIHIDIQYRICAVNNQSLCILVPIKGRRESCKKWFLLRNLIRYIRRKDGMLTFYGPAGEGWVRLALSATDERIDSAVRRLTSSHLRW